MALFTRTAKLDPGPHGARCAWAMAVHHAVCISHQRNSGYRPSRVNIMAQGLSTPDPSLRPTHLSIRRGRTTTTHYTHHQVSLMVSRNITLVPAMGLRIGPACEAGLSDGMRRERVPPRIRKKEKRKNPLECKSNYIVPHRITWSWYCGRWWVDCYIWYSDEGIGRGRSPPRPLYGVRNVTAHPSTTSVPITVLLFVALRF